MTQLDRFEPGLEALLDPNPNSPVSSHSWAHLSICFSPGVCLGMQLAVCEFARNVLGWEGG